MPVNIDYFCDPENLQGHVSIYDSLYKRKEEISFLKQVVTRDEKCILSSEKVLGDIHFLQEHLGNLGGNPQKNGTHQTKHRLLFL
ncbi:hypothetical protein CDAR_566771 [Caerostris darwini]|uniref:Uncharacterized protein n=1 Tax=Caerostris darwini TaxID=1538125 RepID=A0AAV4UDR7_9ARAC|nr:hypothetical protein CDAR_566771 [Caerostris darwini]